ncbi:MAG: hypothetical protein EXQ70_07365 [Solirubrobacterales bacterium]|nr:hypothetical protein [Solirubrobacterales bacterium]
MEASEKPQMHLDNGNGAHGDEPSVRAIGDRLVIERLEVNDSEAARVVQEQAKEGRPPAQTVTRAIEIGARVLESEGTAANVDYVKVQLERNMGAIADRLGTVLDEGNTQLAESIATTFGADRSDSVQQQIREMLLKAGEHQRTEMARLFSAEDGANPLADFKGAVVRALQSANESQQVERNEDRLRIEALTEELTKLRERMGASEELEAEQARGTAKGLDFEARVDAALERIAATRGDASSHTGGEGAEGGGKKGDTLIELAAADGPAAGRVVFEAKDKKLSKNDAWRELNEAMAARAASFGVLVVAGEERVPSGRETLTEYEGNKLIVAVDRDEPNGLALEVAYRLAAARVAVARDREMTVDAPAVRDAAEEAVSCLKQAQAVRAALTGIKTSSDKARATLDEMVEAVRARLERVESLVEVADDDPEAD